MARITIEDCLSETDNRFELVILASERAKEIISGSPILIEEDNDKESVIALREIASHKINIEKLKEKFYNNFEQQQDANIDTKVDEAISVSFDNNDSAISIEEEELMDFSDVMLDSDSFSDK